MPGHSQFLLLLSLRFFVVVYLFGGFVCFFCTSNIIQGIHTWQSCWRLKIKRKWNKCYQFFISIQVKTETIKYIKYFFFPLIDSHTGLFGQIHLILFYMMLKNHVRLVFSIACMRYCIWHTGKGKNFWWCIMQISTVEQAFFTSSVFNWKQMLQKMNLSSSYFSTALKSAVEQHNSHLTSKPLGTVGDSDTDEVLNSS